jgi:hypothetical protein
LKLSRKIAHYPYIPTRNGYTTLETIIIWCMYHKTIHYLGPIMNAVGLQFRDLELRS